MFKSAGYGKDNMAVAGTQEWQLFRLKPSPRTETIVCSNECGGGQPTWDDGEHMVSFLVFPNTPKSPPHMHACDTIDLFFGHNTTGWNVLGSRFPGSTGKGRGDKQGRGRWGGVGWFALAAEITIGGK